VWLGAFPRRAHLAAFCHPLQLGRRGVNALSVSPQPVREVVLAETCRLLGVALLRRAASRARSQRAGIRRCLSLKRIAS